ncbi:MAG TPA: hypothetical protein PLW65_04485 [Pseudomonadota bacterium]|nr:hypothetical protein [Pseudomonadota bacterium]
MTKTVKAHHAGQKPITIWLPIEQAELLDRKLADAAQPGLRPSRSGFILHAIQRALGGTGEAPPAQSPTAALPAPTAHAVEPVQAAEPAQPAAEPELLVALRALFRARKMFTGTDGQGGVRYRDLTEVELAGADRAAATFYENLMDFARAGAAGLNEAPFHPADGWTVEENGDFVEGVYGERQRMPLFSVFSELPAVFGYEAGNYAYRLPGPLAAAQAADAEARAKAQAREDKAKAKAARAAQRAAKAAAATPAPLPDSEPVQAAVPYQIAQAAERAADREEWRAATLLVSQRRGQRAAEPEAEPAADLSPDPDLGPPLFSGAPAPRTSPFGDGPSES